jgi:hypothetical protein
VYRAAAKAGYIAREKLEHVGFGTMNGADGKPFKTRAGGVLKLQDLIGQAEEKARERLKENEVGADFSKEEFEDIAHKVAIAAIKFADLSNFRGTSYVFDLDRFMSFEGKTGPYLLYQAVRIKSILRKAEEQQIRPAPSPSRTRPSARWRWRSMRSTARCARLTIRRRRTSWPSTLTLWRKPSRASSPIARCCNRKAPCAPRAWRSRPPP